MPNALRWEMLAWALPKGQDLDKLEEVVLELPLLNEPQAPVGRMTTLSAGQIKALQKAAKALPDLKDNQAPAEDIWTVVDSRARNARRRELLALQPSQGTIAWDKSRLPHQSPGIWSVRFVPVNFTSPAVRAAVTRGAKLKEDQEGQTHRRILALAMNLRTGGFLSQLLAYRGVHELEDCEIDPFSVSPASVRTFMNRLAPALLAHGGHIVLPRRSRVGVHLNDWIAKWAGEGGIPVSEKLPCLWPGDAMAVEEGHRYQGGYCFRFASGCMITWHEASDEADFLNRSRRNFLTAPRSGRPRKPRAE